MKIAIKHKIKGFVQEELAPLLELLDKIHDAINSNPYVEYEDITIQTPSGINTEFAVTLKNLDRKPVKFELVWKDKACDVYASSTTKWSKNLLYLKATVSSAIIVVRVT